MRVIVRLTGAHRELQEEILAIPERERAERMRLLASMGLACLRRGDWSGGGQEQRPENQPQQGMDGKPAVAPAAAGATGDAERKARRAAIAGKLGI